MPFPTEKKSYAIYGKISKDFYFFMYIYISFTKKRAVIDLNTSENDLKK
jgi:hypothetical protein